MTTKPLLAMAWKFTLRRDLPFSRLKVIQGTNLELWTAICWCIWKTKGGDRKRTEGSQVPSDVPLALCVCVCVCVCARMCERAHISKVKEPFKSGLHYIRVHTHAHTQTHTADEKMGNRKERLSFRCQQLRHRGIQRHCTVRNLYFNFITLFKEESEYSGIYTL